jgi:hypothetical protein
VLKQNLLFATNLQLSFDMLFILIVIFAVYL